MFKTHSKLTLEHVHLTPYYVMNISFAGQVLSSTVADVLRNFMRKRHMVLQSFVNI